MRLLLVAGLILTAEVLAAPPVMTNLNPASRPSARTGPGVAANRVSGGETIFLFGGNATLSGTNNQLWSYSVGANTWTQHSPGGTAPTARAWHNLTWDVGQQRLVLFGGSAALAGPLRNDVHLYNPATDTWSQPTVSGTPPSARFLANMFYVPSIASHLLVFGGTGTSSNAEATVLTNELWRLTINAVTNTATWTLLSPPGTLPVPRASACMGFDPARNRLIVFGGEIINDTITETAQYDVASNTWSIDTVGGAAPSKRGSAVCSFDERSGKLLLYGGVSTPSGSPLGAAYSYDPVARFWRQLTPSPNPGNLTFAGPSWSAGLGAVFFFGGRNSLISVSQATWTFRANAPPALLVQSPVSFGENTLATLSAAASSDLDGDPLTYTWTQTLGPPVTLTNPTTATPSFTTPSVLAPTPLAFAVSVTDGVESADGGVSVTILDDVNEPPVADAGSDQSALSGNLVSLSGSASFDPNGEPITFQWTQSSGRMVTLATPTPATTSFTAPGVPATETLTFLLTVRDSRMGAGMDSVSVDVSPGAGGGAGGGGGPIGGGAGGGTGVDGGAGGGAGTDAGSGDGGSDGGAPADGGASSDAGPDGGSGDAGLDAGSSDAGGGDGGSFDAGDSDAGEASDGGDDGGLFPGDAGLADAGSSDAGPGAPKSLTVGCGCSTTPDWPLALLLFAAGLFRRRRNPESSGRPDRAP